MKDIAIKNCDVHLCYCCIHENEADCDAKKKKSLVTDFANVFEKNLRKIVHLTSFFLYYCITFKGFGSIASLDSRYNTRDLIRHQSISILSYIIIHIEKQSFYINVGQFDTQSGYSITASIIHLYILYIYLLIVFHAGIFASVCANGIPRVKKDPPEYKYNIKDADNIILIYQ